MSSIRDEAEIARLVESLHAALARLRANCGTDAGGRFEEPDASAMTPERLSELGGGSRDEILGALARHWNGRGEPGLAALVPELAALAELLASAPKDDGGSAPRDDLYMMF